MRGEIHKEMFDCVPEIDFNTGSRYFLGNMENYSKALLSILKSIKAKLPILRMMCNNEEFEGLRVILQTLRKMLTNIGSLKIAEETYTLEQSFLNQNYKELRNRLTLYVLELEALSNNLVHLLKNADDMAITNQSNNKSFLNYDFTKTKESIKRSNDLLERKII